MGIGGLNTLGTLQPALSLKPHIPVSPCELRHPLSCHPSSVSQMSTYEWGLVHWPFKRIPGFPAAFHLTLEDGIPSDFQSDVMWTPLPGSGSGLGSPAGD